jgi:alpha-amylase
MNHRFSRTLRSAATLVVFAGAASPSLAQISSENPAPMLQWFECRWADMERRIPDFFVSGYGSTWVPPPSRCYVSPGSPNQNSTSAGYDVFDRFDLGKPSAQTAFGTEAAFHQVITEFHLAASEVYIDTILNHNSFRQTGATFQAEGGYPGFWMAPATPPVNKGPTSPWGDFHAGVSSGYYQSEDPGGARYCLLNGDLVALIDINQASVNNFIRQPTVAGNPQNIPGGTVFNRPDPANARFYPDQALGTTTVNNPGMWFAGALNTGIFAPPCDVPARNEPATQFTAGRFNTADPLAGDPVPENATGYLLRWVQWMMDVHRVDGFRLDAIKHTPSWFFDTFFDSVVANRRLTPDGRLVTPYSFGECVEGNDFTFDRYIRMPNGRTSGRSVAGDAFGFRDALDLNGAGQLRDIIGAGGLGSWNNVAGAFLDNTDDGFQNGSIGMAHIFSHDNGSAGTGGSAPPTPTFRQQGAFAHALLLLRAGRSNVYHNARGVARSGSGFYPRAGITAAMGVEPTSNAANDAFVTLVRLNNWLGRGEYQPRWQDSDVLIFERRTPMGGGNYSGNCLVACNDRYDGGYDQRTVSTSFPAGTRLIEMTGNATNPAVDPNNDIFDTIVVGAGGSVSIRVPRNLNSSNVEHNRGYVVYAPALPAGTLSITNQSGTLAAEGLSVPSWRRRANAVPVVSASSFEIQLTTTNGDPQAANNDNADDNALFRLNAGFQDWNGNGSPDVGYQSDTAPGYEGFVTQRQPLAGTANTNGIYRQAINASLLPEGMNYLSVLAYRKRNAGEAPLFREWRTAIYVDRLPPTASFDNPSPLPSGTLQQRFTMKALDRTVSRIHLILNPPTVGDPLLLANGSNQAVQDDRFDWSRTLTGLVEGANTLLLLAFEESGRGIAQFHTVYVGQPPAPCDPDVNQDGNVDQDDVLYLINVIGGGQNPTGIDPDFNRDGNADQDDVTALIDVVAGGPCP